MGIGRASSQINAWTEGAMVTEAGGDGSEHCDIIFGPDVMRLLGKKSRSRCGSIK